QGPVFNVTSPRALAHALRAPGQLGLGRAYVSGLLEVDDLDAAIAVLDTWKPPPIDAAARVRLMLGGLRAGGLVGPPKIPASELQATLARQRVAEAGVADRVEIRVTDYRELREDQFDAIASIGMVEHVGGSRIDLYAERLAALLKPGGRLLNHGISRLRHSDP